MDTVPLWGVGYNPSSVSSYELQHTPEGKTSAAREKCNRWHWTRTSEGWLPLPTSASSPGMVTVPLWGKGYNPASATLCLKQNRTTDDSRKTQTAAEEGGWELLNGQTLLRVGVYVCVYVCTSTSMYIHIRACTPTCLHATHNSKHAHEHANTRLRVSKSVRL